MAPEIKPGTATVNGDQKMTNTTPKTLADLKHQDWVIDLELVQGPRDTPQQAADFIFESLMPGDERPVTLRQLFTEGDVRVYEAYKDSGSVDYLYIKETI